MLDLSALELARVQTLGGGAPLFLPETELIESTENPRTEFDPTALQELAQDIKARGILQPLVVRSQAGGPYLILYGARRFRAGKLAGLTEFPVVVATDQRHFSSYAQVAENSQREDLSPLDLAAFIEKRLAAGEKKKDIADGLCTHASSVTNLCALIDPPPFILELYHAGKCVSPDYLYRLRTMHSKSPEWVERECAVVDLVTRPWLDDLARRLSDPITTGHMIDEGPQPQPQTPSPKVQLDDAESGSQEPIEPGPKVRAPHDPEKAKYKIVMVKHHDRPAQLVLTRRASAVGLGWIKYADDGHELEIDLGTASLDSLVEA